MDGCMRGDLILAWVVCLKLVLQIGTVSGAATPHERMRRRILGGAGPWAVWMIGWMNHLRVKLWRIKMNERNARPYEKRPAFFKPQRGDIL